MRPLWRSCTLRGSMLGDMTLLLKRGMCTVDTDDTWRQQAVSTIYSLFTTLHSPLLYSDVGPWRRRL